MFWIYNYMTVIFWDNFKQDFGVFSFVLQYNNNTCTCRTFLSLNTDIEFLFQYQKTVKKRMAITNKICVFPKNVTT